MIVLLEDNHLANVEREMSTQADTCEIEFIGGPIDGHIATFGAPPEPFVGAVAPKSRGLASWLRRMAGWIVTTESHTMAVYELCDSAGLLRYQHVSSQISRTKTIPCVHVMHNRPSRR